MRNSDLESDDRDSDHDVCADGEQRPCVAEMLEASVAQAFDTESRQSQSKCKPDGSAFGDESDRAETKREAGSERRKRDCRLATSEQPELGRVESALQLDAFGKSVRVYVAHPEDERRGDDQRKERPRVDVPGSAPGGEDGQDDNRPVDRSRKVLGGSGQNPTRPAPPPRRGRGIPLLGTDRLRTSIADKRSPWSCAHPGINHDGPLRSSRRIASDHDQKEDPMHARLISFSGADPEKRERAIQTIRETVIPMLRQYDGFSGYIALYDAQNRRAKAVLLWESEETAEAAEQELAERRRQLASGIGLTVESADLYEAPVVELEGARV